MKLTVTTFVSVDGVMQGPGGPDEGQDTALEVVESRTTPKGATIQVYRPAGRPGYGTAEVE